VFGLVVRKSGKSVKSESVRPSQGATGNGQADWQVTLFVIASDSAAIANYTLPPMYDRKTQFAIASCLAMTWRDWANPLSWRNQILTYNLQKVYTDLLFNF